VEEGNLAERRGAVRGVLLDIDGTLVDSNDAHTRAWVEALRRGGHRVTYDEVRRLIGMGSDNLLPALVGIEKESAEGEKLSKSWSEIFTREYLPYLKATPGSRELVYRMRESGLRLAVASSAEKEMLESLLEIAGVADLVKEATTSGDADNSKPDPDIVQGALQKIGLPPGEVLMLGDTPYDIEAAAKAGVGVVALRSGGWDDAGLRGALAVYDSPADLLSHFEESPFGGQGA
jgi:HAD superfamily hydrolase (TIGR01509 family)